MSNCMPSTVSMVMSNVWESSTVMTRPCPRPPWPRRSSRDLGVTGGDGTDGSDLLLGLDRLGLLLHLGDGGVDGLVDAATDGQRVGASGDVAQTVVDDGLSEQGCGGGAVTHGVVGLGGNLLHQLSTHVLDVVLELDLLGDRNAVVGDGRSTERALQRNVATLGAHGDGNGVGQSVDALGKLSAGIGVERNVLCMVGNPPKEM